MSFTTEQVFLPTGSSGQCKMQTHCAESGERGGQSSEKIFCLNFSCLAIKYEFYFILVLLCWPGFPIKC